MGQIVVAMLAEVCFKRGGTAMTMERSANYSDEVTEGRNSVRAEEERVEREGWIETADGDRRAERIEVYMYYK